MRFARIHGKDGVRVCAVDEHGAGHEVRFTDTGVPVSDLRQIIDAGPGALKRLAVGRQVVDGRLLAPLVPARNIFCVGRNYSEHAAEFARSGFDATSSPDGDHVPEYPVVFTKPAASVIASGDVVDPHSDLTSALDYEGEIGVIIGRRASKVNRDEAMDYVWGYTLINDVTARDLQRDHKQWFIGKSLDTFCPMGPWAVTADEIDIRDLRLQSRVNGELRQDTNTSQLIFDVPAIIETLSAGITLEPGDVIATGTPVGVGIGFDPPKYLTTGDQVVVSAPGLGQLTNTIGPVAGRDHLQVAACAELFVEKTGQGSPVVLIHGLGGATTVYDPQVAALAEHHTVLRYDLSGHGRSRGNGTPSITGWVEELTALLDAEGIEETAVVAHSMGTLVASTFAAAYPGRVTKLALLGAVRAQGPQAKEATRVRARAVREGGMSAVADTLVSVATSEQTRTERPLAAALVRELLLGQDPDSYAAACDALLAAEEPDFASIKAPVLLLTGSDDKISSLAINDDIFALLPSARLHVIEGIGHWQTLEAPEDVTRHLQDFLARP
ncbi:bifunctional fumarylacetoacetate hydrolase/alpha/beta hydrolase family protein [Streptomyces canus]|uniref:bifunctional fumarylacetoacetate hydrolase/alpha/beta hydrolase family protein n=1 Tax=Streptomyces canus TaxID=58343 RepID=UPI0033A8D66E